MKIPCTKECPERSALCHSQCEAYLAYWEQKERDRKRRLIQSEVSDYVFKAIHRSKTSTREGKEKYG